MTSTVMTTKEATSLSSRLILIVFCLAASFAYRASVSLLPTGIVEDCFLVGLAALLLLIAVLTRRSQALSTYWEIPYAFFVFTVAGFAGDVSISPLQQGFVQYVLYETPSANNPLASTIFGTVLSQVFSTLCLVLPILLLTKESGSDLKSIYIDKTRNRWPLVVGIVGFLAFYLFAATGRAQRFFPNNGVTLSRFLALTPALIVLVLCNGYQRRCRIDPGAPSRIDPPLIRHTLGWNNQPGGAHAQESYRARYSRTRRPRSIDPRHCP